MMVLAFVFPNRASMVASKLATWSLRWRAQLLWQILRAARNSRAARLIMRAHSLQLASSSAFFATQNLENYLVAVMLSQLLTVLQLAFLYSCILRQFSCYSCQLTFFFCIQEPFIQFPQLFPCSWKFLPKSLLFHVFLLVRFLAVCLLAYFVPFLQPFFLFVCFLCCFFNCFICFFLL